MIGAIVGVGKIGLRHLEGSINSDRLKRIYLFDLDNSYRKEASKLVEQSHVELIFLTSLEDLPQELDFLILSTSADSRLRVLQSVLYSHQVHNLLLEKVVFNDVNHFYMFEELTNSLKIDVRVNLSKRFDGLTSFLNSSTQHSDKFRVNVTGGNWGLLCNAIHFIDMTGFIFNRKLLTINANLNPPFASKREGFYEANGSITCLFEGDSLLTMSSTESEAPIHIEVSNQQDIFSWDDTSQSVQSNTREADKGLHLPVVYQNIVTKEHVRQIFDGPNILLPRLDDVKDYHKILIRSLVPYFEQHKIHGCPIT